MYNSLKNILVILLVSLISYSFSLCGNKKSVKEELTKSSSVIIGKILSIDTLTLVDSNQIKSPPDNRVIRERGPLFAKICKYQVSTSRIFKGDFTKDTINVYSGLAPSSFSFVFKKNGTYIIYGNPDTNIFFNSDSGFIYPKGKNIIWVNKCSRTRYKNIREIKEIEKHI